MAAHHQASSSSSSSSAGSRSYEVFLSFNGTDVRTNFADHLYNALVFAGIRTFRDEDELHKGKPIALELLAAIHQSRISIPIFSENYASSKWCLNELTEISECRRTIDQTVLPIFYKVEPRDVRNQTGRYAKFFEEHQMHFDETTVQKWKKAMREVGELDGWDTKNNPYEGKLIKEVVKIVWSTLNKRPLIVSNNLVGIESRIKDMLMLLDIESDDRKIVGIHGLGGIGKTTIARAVYNTVFYLFDGYSFIENVQENAQKHGLPHLQNQLIFDIVKQENQNITSVDDGKNVIQQRFRMRKVLIVLDDVDQDIQVKSLVGNREWFDIGSKIIITSRNRDILIAQKVDSIYEPNEMDLDDSLKHFSHHAFGSDQPLEDYLDLSEAMVKTTGGLPLDLQVIGSSLYLKRKPVWKDMLKNLQKSPNNDVMKRLKIGYDGLNDEEKQMFLDTACFFIGMNKDIACYIWDGCGFSSQLGLDALCVRSLVTTSEKGKLMMHDQLRDLGREIVRQESTKEPGKRTRIWSKEEVFDVLDAHTGTSNVQGLSIDFRHRHLSVVQCLISSEGFAAMTKLRLLKVDYAHFSGNFTHYFSKLRWLSWKGCSELYAQVNFRPWKLVVLDLSHSRITEKWMCWNFIKMAVNLKVLNLKENYSLSRTPDLSANLHLEILILKNCKNLIEIDKSIGYLKKLVKLDISGCKSLLELPFEICQLTSLKTFDLSCCKKLESLPNLPRHLEVLILKECGYLVKINTSIYYIKNLVTLDMSGCKGLVDLPMLSSLNNLEVLCLEGSKELQHISNLPLSLVSLDVRHCSSIRYISGLPSSLTSLYVNYCMSMEKLSSTSGLRNLKRLCLEWCESLEEIEDFDDEGLDSLVFFRMQGTSLKKLPNLSKSKKLRELEIFKCPKLSKIENLEGSESLETLKVCVFTSTKILPDVSTLKNLSYLRIHWCRFMKRLPDLSNLNKLQVISFFDCRELAAIPGLDRLESLQELKIRKCAIKRLPDLSSLKSLTHLEIGDCKRLIAIHALGSLEFLVKLDISNCETLERLPDLSNLKNLNNLQITYCSNLIEIHGVDKLQFLEELDISGCESLERLPDLSNLKKLKVLKARDCKKLAKIQAHNGLNSLKALDVRGCISLKNHQIYDKFRYILGAKW